MNFKEYMAAKGTPKTLRCAFGFHKMLFDDANGEFRLSCNRCDYHWPEPWMIR